MRCVVLLAALAGCAGGGGRTGPIDRSAPVDWDAEGRQAVALLRDLIRFDTVNPPSPGASRRSGGETALLSHVKGVLATAGVRSEIFEAAPRRGNLVARYRAGGTKPPLLLMAHVDVVNFDASLWRVPPLSGTILDGMLWGRGALDDKDDAAVFSQVMMMLHRRRPALDRDVILMLNADEESSGRFGAGWMVEHHWDRIACGVVLNEGGRASLREGKVVQIGIQTEEKIYNDFRLWIRGRGGHSSVPLPGNAIYRLGALLERLSKFRLPVRVTPTMRAQFARLASIPEYRESRETLLGAARGDAVAVSKLAVNPRLDALLRSTFVPTVIRGGSRENKLPVDVEVNINVRLLPGDTIDGVIRKLMTHLGISDYAFVEGAEAMERWKRDVRDRDVAVFLVDRGVQAPSSPLDSDAYRAIEKAALRLAPETVVVPQMSTGATDSRFFRMKGVACYGISPCPAGEEEEGTVHDVNERVPVASVGWGVRFTWETLMELCGSR